MSARKSDLESTTAQTVVVGRIGAAHGVAGAMHVTSFTVPPENILEYRPWLLEDGGGYREVKVRSLKVHGTGFVAQLAGIEDRDRAQALAGTLIAVPRDALPALDPDEEYYWQDLVGLTVVNTAGSELGEVVRLLSTGAHDLLVVGADETLIPFVAAFVLEVDLAGRRILVEWSEPE
ncbi:MAG: ribosome maturation factor RimM [Pseudomonadales bacterium]